MKLSKTLFAALALSLATTAANGAPADRLHNREINIHQAMRRLAPNANIASSPRTQRINALNEKLQRTLAPARAAEQVATPERTFGPNDNFTDMDAPNGELWYYTTTLNSRAVEHQYYTEYVLEEYQFDIYDSRFQLVGTIHDKMRYADDEVMVPGPLAGIDLLPVITRNYFNDDDKLEIAVSIAVNTIYPGYNRYRTVVYSLDGEKEIVTINRNGRDTEVEVDKPRTQYNAFIVDVLNASTESEENYFLTFSGDIYNETDNIDDFDYDAGYWEQLSTVGSSYITYSKADAEGRLTKVFDRYLPYIQMQGDQQSTPPLMTFCRDGQPYLLYPYYREPYFNRIDTYYEDMTMREGNTLIIELYKLSASGAELFSTTEIPALKIDQGDIIGNYYSVGDLNYSHDVSFDADGQPVYVVSRSNYLAGQDDVSGFCFYVYDAQGNRRSIIFEGADADLSLCSIPGASEQHMFVSYSEEDGYVYNMVDLATGLNAQTPRISYLLDAGLGQEEVLLFNADRVAVGDSYKYAFEGKAPVMDDAGNTYMRIAWFNADGSFDRVDNINMGQNIQYAQSYMNGTALAPRLFNDDDKHEYMVLVKRGISTQSSDSQEELLIAQPTEPDFTGGNTLLHLVPSAEKGSLSTIGLYPGATAADTRLMIGYLNYDNYDYTVDFYSLPLVSTAIESVGLGSANGAVEYDGQTLAAAGHDIRLYNATGMLVASGRDALAVQQLPAGIYIATAGKKVCKVVVK